MPPARSKPTKRKAQPSTSRRKASSKTKRVASTSDTEKPSTSEFIWPFTECTIVLNFADSCEHEEGWKVEGEQRVYYDNSFATGKAVVSNDTEAEKEENEPIQTPSAPPHPNDDNVENEAANSSAELLQEGNEEVSNFSIESESNEDELSTSVPSSAEEQETFTNDPKVGFNADGESSLGTEKMFELEEDDTPTNHLSLSLISLSPPPPSPSELEMMEDHFVVLLAPPSPFRDDHNDGADEPTMTTDSDALKTISEDHTNASEESGLDVSASISSSPESQDATVWGQWRDGRKKSSEEEMEGFSKSSTKPYQCSKCGKLFKSVRHVEKHIKRRHKRKGEVVYLGSTSTLVLRNGTYPDADIGEDVDEKATRPNNSDECEYPEEEITTACEVLDKLLQELETMEKLGFNRDWGKLGINTNKDSE